MRRPVPGAPQIAEIITTRLPKVKNKIHKRGEVPVLLKLVTLMMLVEIVALFRVIGTRETKGITFLLKNGGIFVDNLWTAVESGRALPVTYGLIHNRPQVFNWFSTGCSSLELTRGDTVAIKLKPISDLAAKYSNRGQAAAGDYKTGVQAAGNTQKTAAMAASDTWKAAVQDAAARDAFSKGLNKTPDDKWQRNAVAKGSVRYGPGVAAAQNDWATGFNPFYQVLSGLTLPARGLRRSAQNMARVAAVDTALAAAKTGAA